jgi:hypothetical protein
VRESRWQQWALEQAAARESREGLQCCCGIALGLRLRLRGSVAQFIARPATCLLRAPPGAQPTDRASRTDVTGATGRGIAFQVGAWAGQEPSRQVHQWLHVLRVRNGSRPSDLCAREWRHGLHLAWSLLRAARLPSHTARPRDASAPFTGAPRHVATRGPPQAGPAKHPGKMFKKRFRDV